MTAVGRIGRGRQPVTMLLVIAALVAGCTGAPAAPEVVPATPPPTTVPLPSETVRPSLRPMATLSPVASLCAEPRDSSSIYCADKLDEGGHGGPPVLQLSAEIAIDYAVSGQCTFFLGLADAVPDVGLTASSPSLTLTVSGPEIEGTWRPSILPGAYYPVIGQAVGCVYSVNVRDDRVAATPVVSPAPPSPVPSSGRCDTVNVRPSTIAGLDLAARLACYGAATLRFEAQLMVIFADIDYVPLEAPSLFVPMWFGDPSHPVFIVDVGGSGNIGEPSFWRSAFELRTADRSIVPTTLSATTRVLVEGHLDDPASTECRRPADIDIAGSMSDDDAIATCRRMFVTTSLTVLD